MTIFDHELVVVIYVLGGPGAGKGTQCSLLAKEFDFGHISAGELLREEQQKPDSEHGKMIRKCIQEGTIAEGTIMIRLLENAMKATFESKKGNPAWENGKGRFLIDGFPRNMDQALEFDKTICLASFMLYLDCDENTMLERISERGKDSGREDDNVESTKKRFVVYKEETKPVIKYYEKLGKVARVDSRPNKDEVSRNARQAIGLLLKGQE